MIVTLSIVSQVGECFLTSDISLCPCVIEHGHGDVLRIAYEQLRKEHDKVLAGLHGDLQKQQVTETAENVPLHSFN